LGKTKGTTRSIPGGSTRGKKNTRLFKMSLKIGSGKKNLSSKSRGPSSPKRVNTEAALFEKNGRGAVREGA